MTKREAIKGHRKMWNWIADEIERRGSKQDIAVLKKEYCEKYGLHMMLNCFCFEYIEGIDSSCTDSCPVIWGNDMLFTCSTIRSEYWMINRTERWTEQVKLARQIANLPERKD